MKAIDHLLNKDVEPHQLSALVRDAAKGQPLKDREIELRVGDYTDIDSLVKAFQGVDSA